jgi:hypothetical protein
MPEAMGEVMAQHEGLAREYVMILKSYIRTDGNYLEHEPLQRGVLWGLGRLAQERPELVKTVIPHVQPFLSSEDAVLRGLAVWTLGFFGGDQVGGVLGELESDDTAVTLFLNGTERTYRISELARKALDADVRCEIKPM